MKKYFLLVGIFTIMFLGLGNYTFADCLSDCKNTSTIAQTECYKISNKDDQMGCLSNAGKNQANCESTCGGGAQCPGSPGCSGYQETMNDINDRIPCGGGDVTCDGTKEYCNDKQKCVCDPKLTCCGIKLNTSVPFIGNCIETHDQNPDSTLTEESAFPVLMGSLTRILVTVILIVSFVLIIIGGIMIATGNPKGGKDMIMKVVMGIAILGASGVILRLINPNFFG